MLCRKRYFVTILSKKIFKIILIFFYFTHRLLHLDRVDLDAEKLRCKFIVELELIAIFYFTTFRELCKNTRLPTCQ
jgi:hypothetical protein